jgi:prepilin-type N-terminal cleavage/methylation domain-containing protein
MKKQSGFTLIELAIVLVIIGLLLGGVLKGQELINSAKVKNMASDFRNIQVYIYGYQDKYKSLPGDDINAQGHLGNATATNGNGNGRIDGVWSSVDPAVESLIFWQHVRMAGFAPGSTVIVGAAPFVPVNADNGRVGIQSGQTPSITGLNGVNIMCSGGVLGKFSKQLDVNLDDGNPETGSIMIVVDAVQGTSSVTGLATVAPTPLANIGDNAFTTICMAF